jgi:hypothetical protein
VGFEPKISAGERPKTYALDRAATGIGRMRNISDKICREKSTHTLYFQYYFSRKSYRLWDNVETYGKARQATDDVMQRARFVC